MLILCDGGGSNSATAYLLKEDIQKLSDQLGIEIRVTHYPPYCSKYNPTEHRQFPHATRACRGVVFDSVQIAQHYLEKTSTETGITVAVRVIEKVYETGRQYSANFKQTMKTGLDSIRPRIG